MPETFSTEVSGARLRSLAGESAGNRPRRSDPRLRRRLLLGVAVVAFVLGVAFGAGGGTSPSESLALGFAHAWARGDYGAMYADIDQSARRRTSLAAFTSAVKAADVTATATTLKVGRHAHETSEGAVVVPVVVHTYLFGTLHTQWQLPMHAEGAGPRIAWNGSLAFPGLRPGARLTRQTSLPARATLLASDGSVLAEGSPSPGSAEGERASPLGSAAAGVVGDVGPIPASERLALEAQGVPTNATVGISGLERSLDGQLRGRPGGQLLAGSRVIATASPVAAAPVRTSVSPAVQRAAAVALGGQLGGVVVMRPHTGEVLAVSGLGIDDLQPPGSTFKMVTVTGVLQAGVAHTGTEFPYATATTLEGVTLNNAGGESCGGTLALAFAVSCNSVFAPLGVKLGAQRLVATAEAYGFNHDPGLSGAVESTLPQAAQIHGELELGSSAIGQGQVQASPLQMALVAATIADGGHRPQPTFLPGGAARGPAVVGPSVARTVTQLMLGVVESGTGTSAAIPGVEVAGKTGTAELGGTPCAGGSSETGSSSGSVGGESCASQERQNTDAWFAAFAPAHRPRVAVAVMLVRDGYGGETAAPVARQVMEAGLEAKG
jgi:hypothetical protein